MVARRRLTQINGEFGRFLKVVRPIEAPRPLRSASPIGWLWRLETHRAVPTARQSDRFVRKHRCQVVAETCGSEVPMSAPVNRRCPGRIRLERSDATANLRPRRTGWRRWELRRPRVYPGIVATRDILLLHAIVEVGGAALEAIAGATTLVRLTQPVGGGASGQSRERRDGERAPDRFAAGLQHRHRNRGRGSDYARDWVFSFDLDQGGDGRQPTAETACSPRR